MEKSCQKTDLALSGACKTGMQTLHNGGLVDHGAPDHVFNAVGCGFPYCLVN